MQLPVIDRVDFIEYLDYQFQATAKSADEQALAHLLNLTRAHPRSTPQLAWEVWSDFSSHSRVRPALQRRQARGLVDLRDGIWHIVDPLFEDWLRRSSPLADQLLPTHLATPRVVPSRRYHPGPRSGTR